MATRTTREYICDPCGFTSADRKKVTERNFGRKIDVCGPCDTLLAELVGQFILKRQVGGQVTALVPMPAFSNGAEREPTTAEIRAWAIQHGHDVKSMGFLPNAVKDSYRAAHSIPAEDSSASLPVREGKMR